MRSVTPRAAGFGRLLISAVFGTAALGACSDQQPAASRDLRAPAAARALQAFDCTGSTVTGELSCQPASGRAGGARGVLIGGQGTFLQLASTNVSYDSQAEIFSFDVTVQNLMNEAIGTPDGTVADPQGIQVFFTAEPATVSGEGEVTVLNEDGTGFFNAADQPYFTYNQILAKDEVSSSKPWQLSMPSTVLQFSFTVYVETDVQYLLVINEVLVNPTAAVVPEQGGEWFEIYNAGTRPVNLQNLVIADSAASGRRPYHLIASSVEVPSGGYVTLGGSSNTTLNGGVTIDYSYGGAFNLANSLDAVKVARVYGTDTLTIDRTQYGQTVSTQDGVSRELKNPSLDNSNMDGSNWAAASVTSVYGDGGRGTPRAQNSAFTP